MSPVATYRHLISLTGPAYVVVAFFGRLPLAMSQLGTLLLVAGSTGSYAAGGASAGALAIANAVSAPIGGALADRFGQRLVVVVQSIGGACGLVAVVWLSSSGAGWPLLAGVAAVAGFLLPQVGPLARVRWRPITEQRADAAPPARLVDAAFSYEGAADEASFVLGPALVGAAVSLASPGAALLLAAAVLAVFGTWFAVHPTADLTRRDATSSHHGPTPLPTGSLVILAFAQLTIGMVFGSVQTGTTVLATAADQPGATGLLHALLGVGSVLAGLGVAALPERFGYERRLVVFAAALFVLALPLLVVDALGTLSGALLLLGFAVAPYMITVFTLAERVTPRRRVGAAMSLLAGATGLGYAVGSSVAGRLADWNGHTPAFAVTVSAGLLATLLATAASSRLARVQRSAGAASSPTQAQSRTASSA